MASMLGTLGPVTVDCPVCARPVTVEVRIEAPTIEDGNVVAVLVPDTAAVEAHWLTHSPHDGEPLPAAA